MIDPDSIVFPWDTPKHNWHNTRVLCDLAGLFLQEKNTICACIYQESEFFNYLPNGKPIEHKNLRSNGIVSSTDWGICQINDHYHIGPQEYFSSVDYVLAHPSECVSWMIKMYQVGRLGMWCSYSSGAYKEHLLPGSPMWALAS